MSIVVISPHTDDAIFSLGDHFSTLTCSITIVSPMAGVPEDSVGREKHTTLRAEHQKAADIMGSDVRIVNGDFLDDVYPGLNHDDLEAWLYGWGDIARRVYIPLGIHHPDHIAVSDACLKLYADYPDLYVYEELPYRLLYPEKADLRRAVAFLSERSVERVLSPKERAVRAYASQTKSEELVDSLLGPERVWRVL